MIQWVLTIICVIAPAVCAQTTRESSDPAELHRQAVAWMQSEQFDKAAAALERVYRDTPPEQRSRALVLNHAIVDLVQKRFVMRAVRDLSDYLARHRGDDEFATNVLGSALDVAAEKPPWKNGAVWQAGFREWDRRNYILEHSREGWHRWGTRWIDEEKYKAIEAKKEDLRQSVDVQVDRLNRAILRANSAMQMQQNVRDSQRAFNQARQYLQQVQVDPRASITSKVAAKDQDTQFMQEELNSWMSARQIQGELAVALREVQAEQLQLLALKQEQTRFRPEWPRRYDAVDPDAPPPATTNPAVPPASNSPASQPAPIGADVPFGPPGR